MALTFQNSDITLNSAATVLTIVAGNDLLLAEAADLTQLGTGVGIFASLGSNNLDLRGTVTTATASAVIVGGVGNTNGDNQVFVDATAELVTFGSGTTMIVGGGTNTVINHGAIRNFESTALSLLGDNNFLVNYGTISGDSNGLLVNQETSGGAELTNYGHISGLTDGVEIFDGTSTFTNFGTVTGGERSFFGAFQADTLINRGILNGRVSLLNGNDTFDGRGGTVIGYVAGGSGNDTYIIDDSTIDLFESAGEGIDEVQSTVGWRLDANFENLTLIGSADVRGIGNGGNNTVTGNIGDNMLSGKVGNDTLNGGDGNDRLYGGFGNDTLDGGTGADSLTGGSGNDTASYASSNTAVTVSLLSNTGTGGTAAGDSLSNIENVTGSSFNDLLAGDGGSNVLTGLAGNDTLNGGGGNDTLNGNSGNDTLNGKAGNDTLNGGVGADTLFGNANNDTLNGGGGQDTLTGGAGNDTFLFKALSDSGPAINQRDIITDFAIGSDTIDVSGIDAISGGGDNSFTFLGSAVFTGSAGELRVVTPGSNTRILMDVDGDSVSDVSIDLTGTLALTAGDFIL